jgi:hypothetical protein
MCTRYQGEIANICLMCFEQIKKIMSMYLKPNTAGRLRSSSEGSTTARRWAVGMVAGPLVLDLAVEPLL